MVVDVVVEGAVPCTIFDGSVGELLAMLLEPLTVVAFDSALEVAAELDAAATMLGATLGVLAASLAKAPP